MGAAMKWIAIAGWLTAVAIPAEAQELPTPILTAALRHLTENDSADGRGKAVLVTRAFPDPVDAAEAARELGMSVFETRAAILVCTNAKPRTCDIGDGAQIIDLQRFERTDADAVLRVLVSTHVRDETGGAKLFPILREITLRRVRGVWRVVGDVVLMRA